MSLTRCVDTVLNAPIKRPNGLRCARVTCMTLVVCPKEPAVEAVREPHLHEPPLRQGRQACDEGGISHRRFAYQDRVGACVS